MAIIEHGTITSINATPHSNTIENPVFQVTLMVSLDFSNDPLVLPVAALNLPEETMLTCSINGRPVRKGQSYFKSHPSLEIIKIEAPYALDVSAAEIIDGDIVSYLTGTVLKTTPSTSKYGVIVHKESETIDV